MHSAKKVANHLNCVSWLGCKYFTLIAGDQRGLHGEGGVATAFAHGPEASTRVSVS